MKRKELKNQGRARSIFWILLLTAAVHMNLLFQPLLNSSVETLTSWALIHDLRNLPRFFFAPVPAINLTGMYAPLQKIFFSVTFLFWNFRALGHHATNLAIHVVGVWAVYFLVRTLLKDSKVAVLAALMFGIHPALTSSVAQVSHGGDLLGAVLMMFAAGQYFIATGCVSDLAEQQTTVMPRRYRTAVVLSALAVFTTEQALILPIIFLFCELLFNNRRPEAKILVLRLLPFFVIAGAYLAVKRSVLGNFGAEKNMNVSAFAAIPVMLLAAARYVIVSLWPVTLTENPLLAPGFSANDPQFAAGISMGSLPVILGGVILAGITYLAARSFRRYPWLAWSWGWFLLCLFPTFGSVSGRVSFSERFLYAALPGVCLVASVLLLRLSAALREMTDDALLGKRAFQLILVGLVFFLGGRTWLRNGDFSDPASFYTSEMRANPGRVQTYNDLGNVQASLGLADQAVVDQEKAIRLAPDDSQVFFSLADAYMLAGKEKQAQETLIKAIELEPQFAEAYYNLASLFFRSGQQWMGMRSLDKAVNLYIQQGRVLEAGEQKNAMLRFLAQEKKRQGLEKDRL